MNNLIKVGVTALTLGVLAIPAYADPIGNSGDHANGNAHERGENADDRGANSGR
jgi:hypothetical protein